MVAEFATNRTVRASARAKETNAGARKAGLARVSFFGVAY